MWHLILESDEELERHEVTFLLSTLEQCNYARIPVILGSLNSFLASHTADEDTLKKKSRKVKKKLLLVENRAAHLLYDRVLRTVLTEERLLELLSREIVQQHGWRQEDIYPSMFTRGQKNGRCVAEMILRLCLQLCQSQVLKQCGDDISRVEWRVEGVFVFYESCMWHDTSSSVAKPVFLHNATCVLAVQYISI